jgi:hypothetical protein
MQGLTTDRRRARAARRKQIRRRRLGAAILAATLVSLAVWAAVAVPAVTPARVPETAVSPTFGAAAETDRVVVASVRGVEVMLPVAPQATTAVAFHPVDVPDSVAFSPVGDRVSGGGLTERLAEIVQNGGGVQYYLMAGDGGEESGGTCGLSVGAVPGSDIVSPVDGVVTAVKRYRLLGRHDDYELHVQMAGDPTQRLVLTHVAGPLVGPGDQVVAGETPLGQVRDFPEGVEQALRRLTSDDGDHVELMVLRVPAELSGF